MTRYARLKTDFAPLWPVNRTVIPAGTIVEVIKQRIDKSLVHINELYNVVYDNKNLEFLDD